MSLAQQLLNVVPREESGSSTSGKYDYQKDLSLFLLLEKHEVLDDYVFLFDFHDDLVILDSATSPDKMDFYQIKSKEKNNWTIRLLTKAEKDKLSIIGKLYLNKVNFGEHAKTLNFISNAQFSFKDLTNGTKTIGKTEIIGSELDIEDLQTIDVALTAEHSLKVESEFDKIGAFYVSILSSKDSKTHCVGALNTLINKLNPDNAINPEFAYQQIINEVSRKTKTTVSDKSIKSIDDLIELKGIAKSQFMAYLKQAGLYRRVQDEWVDISSSLVASNVGHFELMKFKKAWIDLAAILIKDTNKIPLKRLISNVGAVIGHEKSTGNLTNNLSLIEIVNHCFPMVNNSIYDEYFVKCLIIHQLNEE